MSAGGGTRTPKGFRPPAPKAGASTNCATPAGTSILGRAGVAGQRGLCTGELLQTPAPAVIVPGMPPARTLRPGYTVIHPNRDKAAAKVIKAIVVLILLVSVGLMLIVTFGGWSKLQGLKPLNFAWCIAYLVIAYYVWRWNRGLLPIAAGLAILLLMVVLIAGTGQFGSGSATSWFDRNVAGFAPPQSIFGGKGLSPDFLGLMVVLLIPVQVLLIVFAMIGLAQGWNVEMEVPIDEAKRRGRPPIVPPAEPTPA